MNIKGLRISSALILSTVFALSLRLWLAFFIRRQPAGDEIWAILLSKASFSDIWLAAFSTIHGPLYFSLIHAIGFLVPINLTLIKLFSLVFGVLSSLSIFFVANKFYGEKTAKIALVLSLFLPSFLWISIFGRYYSFLVFLCVFSIYFFKRFLDRGKIFDLAVLIFLSAIGIYTHYYFVLVDVSFTVGLIFVSQYRKLFSKWVFKEILTLLFLLPGAYFFAVLPKLDLTGQHTNTLLKIPALFVVNFTSWEELVYLFYRGTPHVYYPVFLLLGVSAVILIVRGFLISKNEFRKILLLFIIVPPILAFIFSYTIAPLLALNSLVIFVPAHILLFARGIAADLKAKGLLTTAFFASIFFCVIFFVQSSSTLRDIRPDFSTIVNNFSQGDVILHSHLYSYLTGVYLFSESANLGIEGSLVLPKYIQNSLNIKLIRPEDVVNLSRTIWLVEPQDAGSNLKPVLLEKYKEVRRQIFPWTSQTFQEYYFNVYLFVLK